MIFFFQAEDGIRDAQESRGLGDVYKRQVFNNKDDLLAKLSGFTAAIVFGVISENIKMKVVSKTAPRRTFPPK